MSKKFELLVRSLSGKPPAAAKSRPDAAAGGSSNSHSRKIRRHFFLNDNQINGLTLDDLRLVGMETRYSQGAGRIQTGSVTSRLWDVGKVQLSIPAGQDPGSKASSALQ